MSAYSGPRSYARIWAEVVGATAPVRIPENRHRRALLIQNLSVNTLYLMSISSGDITKALQIAAGGYYENSVACKGEYFMLASGAASDIRIQEEVEE